MATSTETTNEDLSEELLYAARSDDLEEVKSCIEKGANVNFAESFGNSTPLHYGTSYTTLEQKRYISH